jgi:hypothetical protein
MAREFPEGRFKIDTGLLTNDEELAQKQEYLWGARSGPGRHSGFGFLTDAPCEQCNNGWMSRLESAVIPVLKPLMWGRDIAISSGEKLVLAQWMVKTTMAWEFFHRREFPRFFTRSQRRNFSVEPHLIPDNVVISIARYAGGNAAWIGDAPVDLFIAETATEGHGYTATFVVGQIALQIFAYRWAKPLKVPSIEWVHKGISFRDAGCEVWPLDFLTIQWPPRFVLDQPTTIKFARRWLDDVVNPRASGPDAI